MEKTANAKIEIVSFCYAIVSVGKKFLTMNIKSLTHLNFYFFLFFLTLYSLLINIWELYLNVKSAVTAGEKDGPVISQSCRL